MVFDGEAARGRGPMAQTFQQIVAAEQRPVVVARPGLDPAGIAAVAWDIVRPIPLAIIWAISGAAVITWSLAAYWSVRLRFAPSEGEDPQGLFPELPDG